MENVEQTHFDVDVPVHYTLRKSEQRGADGDQLRSGADRFSLVTGTGPGRRLQADACSQVTSVIISLSNNASDVAYLKQSIKEMRPGGTAPLRCVLRRTCRRSR